jgi:hypothetical protein
MFIIKVTAPFTPEQVESLNGYQSALLFHPFTCRHRDDGKHTDEAVLIASTDGWQCPCCDYRQDWAHAFMADGSWRQFREELDRLLGQVIPPLSAMGERNEEQSS